jgi:hypothetical protein
MDRVPTLQLLRCGFIIFCFAGAIQSASAGEGTSIDAETWTEWREQSRLLRHYQPAIHLARDQHYPRPDEHLTRETVFAAGALLAGADPRQWEEAARALRRVLPYQDIAPQSNSFGNWPRVIERPGDFRAQNIGGFIGAELIHILKSHRERLPSDLVLEVEEALRRAALRSVRYNPPVEATNIVTKALSVALLADEMLDVPEARAWGIAKLEELHAHTRLHQMPSEYNSPTYNRVSMEGILLLKTFLQNETLRPLIDDLYRATWWELIHNYHPNLQLWTGPATRRYANQDSPVVRLRQATGDTKLFGEGPPPRLPHSLPPEFLPFLQPLDAPETRQTKILLPSQQVDAIFQLSPIPQTATVHQDPHFSVGSFNRGDLWSQRRPLIAFWGNLTHPGILALMSPSTGNGLMPAQVYVAQDGPRLIVIINFITDAGWGLNPWDLYGINRSTPVQAGATRLRLHSEGTARLHFDSTPSNGEILWTQQEGITLGFRPLHADFGSNLASWEVSSDGHLDLILSAEPGVELNSLSSATAAFALEMSSGPIDPTWLNSVILNLSEETITLTADGDLQISALRRPQTYAGQQKNLRVKFPFTPTPIPHHEN